MSFTVTITTAPRRDPTLHECYRSLRCAGFVNSEFIVSAEPGAEIPEELADYVHHNSRRLGVWLNFIQSCELALATDADYIVTAQDDLKVVHPETCQWLLDWFELMSARGPVSLYTNAAYSHRGHNCSKAYKAAGVHPVSEKKLWGAVGFAWRRADLEALISHPIVGTWRGYRNEAKRPEDATNSDAAIGCILIKLGMRAWFPHPSLGRHIAKYSTLKGHGNNDVRRNRDAERTVEPGYRLADQLRPSGSLPEANQACPQNRHDAHREEPLRSNHRAGQATSCDD